MKISGEMALYLVRNQLPQRTDIFSKLYEVFLRMLEYYEGILFLATNRLETMDVAFQSRIHVPVKYEALDSAARRQIWKNFIMRLDERESEGKQELLEALDNLQHWE